MNILTRVLESFCLSKVRIQWVLFLMSTTSNFVSSQRVPMPPEAPLELNAAMPFFFQNFLLTWRNAASVGLYSARKGVNCMAILS